MTQKSLYEIISIIVEKVEIDMLQNCRKFGFHYLASKIDYFVLVYFRFDRMGFVECGSLQKVSDQTEQSPFGQR